MSNEIRIATWRANATLPLPRYGAQVIRYVLIFKFLTQTGFVLGAMGVIGRMFFWKGTFYTAMTHIGAEMLFLSSFTVFNVWSANKFAVPRPVLDHGDDLPRMNVAIRLETDGKVYGEDRGELTIADDWLVFEGERTTFSISPQDVTQLRRRFQIPLRKGVDFRINAARNVRLRVFADSQLKDAATFLSPWIDRTDAKPGISVLPPLQPMPTAWRKRVIAGLPPNSTYVKNAVLIVVWTNLFAVGAAFLVASKIPNEIGFPLEVLASVVVLLPIWAYQRWSRYRALAKLENTRSVFPIEPMTENQVPIPSMRKMQEEGVQTQSILQ